MPATVVTTPAGETARTQLLSSTSRFPAPSKAMPLTSLKDADVPVPSAKPVCLPAKTDDTPAGLTTWMTPHAAKYTLPVEASTASASGSEKAASVPAPSTAGFVCTPEPTKGDTALEPPERVILRTQLQSASVT